MARITIAALAARLAALEAENASLRTAASTASDASSHWKERDIKCTVKACKRTDGFRTVKGRDWHVANVHAAK